MEINGSLLIILLAIFCARIVDVSIGTLRIIFLTRGMKYLAALLGFAESLIWIIAISQVMNNVNNWMAYLAFAGGFSSGNVVGIWLEEKIALGTLIVRIITQHEAEALVDALRAAGFGVTNVDGQGESGRVMVIFTIVRRKRLAQVIALIRRYNPNASYTVEDVRFASSPLAGLATTRRPFALRRPFKLRK
ncbi:MAG TPA: DUF2179 domain-containing protein [Geopsychrobacteraceae bacterium]|jgi:uncharacterized protein YebE (UPF0316 family)